MKPYPSIAAFLVLLLCISPLCVGQTSSDCDQLRSKIKRLKKIDVKGMSASIQQVHSESLIKLYTQLIPCLEQEIVITNEMSNTVAGTDAAKAVEDKLQALIKEKADTKGELTVVRTALNLPDTGGIPGDSTPRAESMASSSGGSPAPIADSAGAAASPGPIDTPASEQTTFPCLPGEAYADAPPLLTDIVEKAAGDVVRGENNGDLSGIPQMMLYATMDAASPTSSELLRGLEAYQYLSETARTDKQLGGAANSNGAVSAIEKPGFASLLGFAVEHGAINKKNDGTNLTLSTSLYSLYVMNKENTAETYQRAGLLNRVGVAATFGIDNTTNDLANARRNNLSEWSVRARLFGDRSTRSAKFQKFWKEKIAPLIDARLVAIGKPIDDLTSSDEANKDYKILRRQGGNCLRDAVKNRKADADYQGATNDVERTKILSDVLLGALKTNVYNRIKTGQLKLSEQVVTAIETRYVPNLKAALDDLTKAGGEVEKKLEDLKKAPLATFAYTNYRIPTGSDYSEAKFLFEQDKGPFGPMKLTGNFGLSFYNKPDQSLNQQRLRELTAALSFEGTSDSPFTEAENQSKITYAFVGRYERLYENRNTLNRTPDIGALQFVMEIPLFKGLSLPLSVTYSNATEEEKKEGFRFNFGTRLDMDKLVELLRVN